MNGPSDKCGETRLSVYFAMIGENNIDYERESAV